MNVFELKQINPLKLHNDKDEEDEEKKSYNLFNDLFWVCLL